jgi:uncharacterized membrane protein
MAAQPLPGTGGRARAAAWVGALTLVAIVIVFAGIRLATDVPNLRGDVEVPPDEFGFRYAQQPWLAYAHILPGLVYLLGAPLQLSLRFRSRHLTWHRRVGRAVLPAGILSGVFAVLFGGLYSFGGWLEASAAIVFGVYFIVALLTAYRAVRGGDVQGHRRWMIRAFAIGVAVGTIRLWIGLFEATGVLTFQDAFGPAFWLSFVAHWVVAELWLRWRPVGVATLPTRAAA